MLKRSVTRNFISLINTLYFTLALLIPVSAQDGNPFEKVCELPFHSIAVERDIDMNCGKKGIGTSRNTIANEIQNAAKNNFCAKSRVYTLKTKHFIKLHKKVLASEISFGNYLSVPVDRSGLSKLGEGRRVQFIGYISAVHYSNVGNGEGVNCKKKTAINNDIHIELTEKQDEEDKCMRISAEISPHFRPNAWNVSVLKKAMKNGLKLKLMGQLFFDASHGACEGGLGGYRASSWEIHPVYRIEVLYDGEWKDLHEWNETF